MISKVIGKVPLEGPEHEVDPTTVQSTDTASSTMTAVYAVFTGVLPAACRTTDTITTPALQCGGGTISIRVSRIDDHSTLVTVPVRSPKIAVIYPSVICPLETVSARSSDTESARTPTVETPDCGNTIESGTCTSIRRASNGHLPNPQILPRIQEDAALHVLQY